MERAREGYFVRDPERNLVYCPNGGSSVRNASRKTETSSMRTNMPAVIALTETNVINNPTLIENGTVKNVWIETGGNSERIGGIIGGGFYSPAFKEYYPEPAKSDIKSCTVSEFTVSGGKYVGAAVGYSYGTTSVGGFDSTMSWNGSESEEQLGADESIKLEDLK